MKITHLLTLVLLLVFGTACDQGSRTSALESRAEVLSYALGVSLGRSLQQGDFSEAEGNTEKLVEGFMAGFEVDSAEIATTLEILNKRRRQGGIPVTDKEEGGKIAFYLGQSIIGPYAVEIDINKADFDRTAFKIGIEAGKGLDSIVISQVVRDSILFTYMESKHRAYTAVVRAKEEAAKRAEARTVIEAGEKFLAENKTREGVITTSIGLQYEILKEGTGARATANDQVKVHYHGTLWDGTVFDSSVERDDKAIFSLSSIVLGWREGILLMKEGARYRFYIPYELAYGLRSHPLVPKGSMLIFEVELFEINPE